MWSPIIHYLRCAAVSRLMLWLWHPHMPRTGVTILIRTTREKLYFTRERSIDPEAGGDWYHQPRQCQSPCLILPTFCPINGHWPMDAQYWVTTKLTQSRTSSSVLQHYLHLQIDLSTNKKYTTVCKVDEVQLTSPSPSPHFSQGLNQNREVHFSY